MTLPNFLIIGAAKSGTSSLYRYLRAHPDVFMSPIKETNFFAFEGEKGRGFPVTTLEQYEALFSKSGDARAVGEASPRYMVSEIAAESIKRTLPEARLVAILRHPVDRAYSGFQMQKRSGRERRRVEEAFKRGDIFVETGFYYRQLRRYYDRFDESAIRILLFEDLVTRPETLLAEVYEFVGVEPSVRPDLKVHNRGGFPKRMWLHAFLATDGPLVGLKSWVPEPIRRLGKRIRRHNLLEAEALPEEIRTRLLDLYSDDILSLQDMIGRDLSRWLR